MVYEEYGFKKMSFDKIERHGRTKYSTLDVSVRGKNNSWLFGNNPYTTQCLQFLYGLQHILLTVVLWI